VSRLDLLVGPNDAGKTTLFQRVINVERPGLPFVNADLIAAQRWPEDPSAHAYDAARIAAQTRRQLIEARIDFATETVFSHESKVELVDLATAGGYDVVLHVVMIPLEMSAARVERRAAAGGHAVPHAKLAPRYARLWPLVVRAMPRCHRALSTTTAGTASGSSHPSTGACPRTHRPGRPGAPSRFVGSDRPAPCPVRGAGGRGGSRCHTWVVECALAVIDTGRFDLATAPTECTSTSPADAGPASLAEGVDLLEAFSAAAAARHRAEVEVVTTLGVLMRAGVVEPLEHLPVDVYLSVRQRFTSPERHMLTDAAEMLADMPATTGLWTDGVLSWSQIRTLVTRLRRYGRPLRVQLDACLAASTELLDLVDADRFDDLVCQAIDALRTPEDVAEEEAAIAGQAYLAARASGDGTVALHGEYAAVDAATVLGAIDAQAARDTAQHGDRRGDGRPLTRAQRRARALANLCRDSLAGHTGRPVAGSNGRCCRRRPASPTMVVHVPWQWITQSAAGVLEVPVPGYLPTLTATTVEALAADAEVRVVIFNGHRPLMVTEKLSAADIPDDTRLAVQARDLGARDPGGRTTVPLSDVHHLGGDGVHDPDRMAVVSPRGHHRILHRHGWSGQVDPATGRITWTSPAGQTITTLPWSARLRAER
jgi:predicted ABC-type ATPase